MRSTFLLFLLVGLSTGSLDWKARNKLSKTLYRLKSRLNVNQLLKIQEKINTNLKAPTLSVQQKILLVDRLKEVDRFNDTHYLQDLTIEDINEKERMSELLYQGDIVLTAQQAEVLTRNGENRWKRQALTNAVMKWPHILYYSFRRGETNTIMKNTARKAAKLWHDNTCIDMVENATSPERVEIFEGKGCYSYVGNIHQIQELSLGYLCHTLAKAAHELAHALGLLHVHSRYDRDKYVIINVKNIPANLLKNDFALETKAATDNYDVPYDYGSRMHYPASAFALDKSMPTIIPVDKNYGETMGSPFVSFYDILLMNKHYGCLDKCKSVSTAAKCKMGGFPNPRDCSKCICPGGYGGRLCDERPSGCGEILTATNQGKTLQYTLGKCGSTLADYEFCHFWIKAVKKGEKVQVRLKQIFSQFVSDGCTPGGVEIKAQKDQSLTGYRYCRQSNGFRAFLSEGDTVPIIIYRERGEVSVQLEYRMCMSFKSLDILGKIQQL